MFGDHYAFHSLIVKSVYSAEVFKKDMFRYEGRLQNQCSRVTSVSSRVTESSSRIHNNGDDLCKHFTEVSAPSVYTYHSNLIPPTQMVQMAFCDFSHTFQNQFPEGFCGSTV